MIFLFCMSLTGTIYTYGTSNPKNVLKIKLLPIEANSVMSEYPQDGCRVCCDDYCIACDYVYRIAWCTAPMHKQVYDV